MKRKWGIALTGLMLVLGCSGEEMKFAPELPAYYHKHLSEKIVEIQHGMPKPSGVSFVFFTDLHVTANALNSKFLIHEIFAKTEVAFGLFGGDVVATFGPPEAVGNSIKTWQELIRHQPKPIFSVRGNHDFYNRVSREARNSTWTSNQDVHQFLLKTLDRSRIAEVPDRNYYSFDLKDRKIRFIALDLYETRARVISPDQVKWLEHMLVEDGWTYVIFAHEPGDPKIPNYSHCLAELYPMFKALNQRGTYDFTYRGVTFQGDFTRSTSRIACILAGHTHQNAGNRDGEVLTITTTCDAHYQDDKGVPRRVVGTVTEQALDVMTINPADRTIKAIRIGAGNNRNWTY